MVDNNDLILGKDLKLNKVKLDFSATASGDLDIKTYKDNLSQALWHRLSTKKGELSRHPEYGSEIHEIVGELNNPDNREKIRLLAAECISQDPRVESIESLTVEEDSNNPFKVQIKVSLTPITYYEVTSPSGAPYEFNLTYAFYLDSGTIDY
jgi:phage baseplate assembly protein W